MRLDSLWTSQRTFSRFRQIPSMIEYLRDHAGFFESEKLIRLVELDDDEYMILDGHHRCIAAWLAGKSELSLDEVVFYDDDHYHRPIARLEQAVAFVRERIFLENFYGSSPSTTTNQFLNGDGEGKQRLCHGASSAPGAGDGSVGLLGLDHICGSGGGAGNRATNSQLAYTRQ